MTGRNIAGLVFAGAVVGGVVSGVSGALVGVAGGFAVAMGLR